jgi:hypothetical protein
MFPGYLELADFHELGSPTFSRGSSKSRSCSLPHVSWPTNGFSYLCTSPAETSLMATQTPVVAESVPARSLMECSVPRPERGETSSYLHNSLVAVQKGYFFCPAPSEARECRCNSTHCTVSWPAREKMWSDKIHNVLSWTTFFRVGDVKRSSDREWTMESNSVLSIHRMAGHWWHQHGNFLSHWFSRPLSSVILTRIDWIIKNELWKCFVGQPPRTRLLRVLSSSMRPMLPETACSHWPLLRTAEAIICFLVETAWELGAEAAPFG